MNGDAVNVGTQVGSSLLISLSLEIHPVMELLDNVMVLFIILGHSFNFYVLVV